MASIIDQLIHIKELSSSSDIITMMDEFVLYGRLSRSTALGNISDSPVLQKRLPLITKAVQGAIYELSLLVVASDIIQHLTGSIPDHIQAHLDDIPERTRRQLVAAQNGTLRVHYEVITAYHHESQENDVIAVYTNKQDTHTSVLIITHNMDRYTIYQGRFDNEDGDDAPDTIEAIDPTKTYIHKSETHEIHLDTYSNQGNNGYFFAQLHMDGLICHMMIPTPKTLWLSASPHIKQLLDPQGLIEIQLNQAEINTLNMSKHSVEAFTTTLSKIISRWEEES